MKVPRGGDVGDGRWRALWRVVMPVLALLVGYQAVVFAERSTDSWLRWVGFAVFAWCFAAVGPGVAAWWRRLRTGSWSEPGMLAELRGGDWLLRLDAPGPAPEAVVTAIREITGLKRGAARVFVRGAPSLVAGGLSEEGMRRAVAILDDAGASVSTWEAPAE